MGIKIRNFRNIIKDLAIYFEWFYNEVMSDIKSLLNFFFSIKTYKSIFYNIVDGEKKASSPKYLTYTCFLFSIVFLTSRNYLLSAIFFAFTFYLYSRWKWVSGEPLSFYRKRYFSDENQKV